MLAVVDLLDCKWAGRFVHRIAQTRLAHWLVREPAVCKIFLLSQTLAGIFTSMQFLVDCVTLVLQNLPISKNATRTMDRGRNPRAPAFFI
jgi:hypothetical protein